MAVNAVSTGADVPVVDRDKIGFSGLTSDVFLKLLIAQLKNQDPTEPVGNEELLQQLSTMRGLQANIELSETLKQITSNQQISSGTAFLGKVVSGTSTTNEDVTGIADRVFLRDGETIIGVGDYELPLKNIVGVSLGIG